MQVEEKETIYLEREKRGEKNFMKNEITLVFDAVSMNESFARVVVAAFATSLDPTLEEIADIKTAVSEAVTNAIIHGYDNVYGYKHQYSHKEVDMYQGTLPKVNEGKIMLHCIIEKGVLHIDIEDYGKGIDDIEKAMEPLYTTKQEEERSGMGFSFMEAFMDELEVESKIGRGTKIHMKKKIGNEPWIQE